MKLGPIPSVVETQLRHLAAVGGAEAANVIDIDEEDFPNTLAGAKAFKKAKLAAYMAFSQEEKHKWYNAVLSVLGYEFDVKDEEDEERFFPYFRSSMHGETFREAIFALAKEKYPAIYIALTFAKQRDELKYKIDALINQRDYIP